MPYYRIIVWTKRRNEPFKGIRLIADVNINAVYQRESIDANKAYRDSFIDVEVQMLSKLCKPVREFELKTKP